LHPRKLITLARNSANDCCLEPPPIVSDHHSARIFNSVDNWPGIANAIAAST
jgi:hypothetical protein